MHAHTHLSHKYTCTDTYICIMHTDIYVCMYIHTFIYPVSATRSYTYTRGRPHMRVPTRLSTRARIGGAAAHNGPRRIDDPPSASRLRWRAARAQETAHTEDNEVTAAVFHAPMSALNADADQNACEPSQPRSTPTERARMCRRGCAHKHTRARARTQHVGACVRRARIGDPFVRVASRTWNVDIFMHHLDIHCMCVLHRWMALKREPVALAHMPRISASSAPAHDRTRMQEHTRVPIYMPRLCLDIYIFSYMTCALAIYTGGRTHART
jgi:hypothetical protein